ncbi:hypothetical protein F2P56_000027 [Juglans regia]|uniref:NAC domain-containing protein n=1 Tax=Juglans regia TaxID=51240 RepID=A0A834D799_JUGRE|nr:hypothetical protein F2P56_000027 [Juglans regia]
MDEKNDVEKVDDVILPGFRFHPTDEELVGFYLKRKIQQRTLPIELIKPVDIYKYDPWDLPKVAATGEKEWYFYCPRDRKYRNSARPNRVTGAGFWKATGTDRPIYSSDGSKCIGLKKSLVFYRGRAAKGIKTDWMMHEFRLPSLSDLAPPKKFLDKNIPANDSWAICRIFKKTNSMAQRALSHSWVSSLVAKLRYTTLSNDSWRGINTSPNPAYVHSRFPSHFNGLHYWLSRAPDNIEHRLLLSFDMSDEVFLVILLPPAIKRSGFEDIAGINDPVQNWAMRIELRDDGLVVICIPPDECLALHDPKTRTEELNISK